MKNARRNQAVRAAIRTPRPCKSRRVPSISLVDVIAACADVQVRRPLTGDGLPVRLAKHNAGKDVETSVSFPMTGKSISPTGRQELRHRFEFTKENVRDALAGIARTGIVST